MPPSATPAASRSSSRARRRAPRLRAWAPIGARATDPRRGVTPGEAGRVLRELAPRIAAELTVFEALPARRSLTRVHGDYHLGQVLIAPDGFRVVDFEGEPIERVLRSAGRTGRRCATSRRCCGRSTMSGGVPAGGRRRAAVVAARAPGLDLDGWLRRSRERFLEAYRAGLRDAGSPVVVDPALLIGRSRSKRRHTSSSTPAHTCRRGCGRRPRGCAGLFGRAVVG